MKKILLTLLFLFSFDALAQNDTPQEMIKKFVQIIGDQIIDVAKDKSLSEFQKKQKIINIIDKSTDSKWIARFVLGKNHKTANEEQKKQFMSMYREFMINTYGPKFNSYDGKKFAVNSVEKQSNFYLVKSEFIPKNSDIAIFFDFRIKENEGNFFIVDFIAEGVSLIETQRSEFNSSINEEGMDKFLENLKKRIDSLRLENGKPSVKNSKKSLKQ
jgi:phospholipid transport system substrate-binding protein